MTRDDSSDGRWLEIAVEVAGIDSETAADLLRQACPGGVAVELASRFDRETDTYVTDADAPAVVKGYLRPGPSAERLRRSLEIALQTAPLREPPAWREARVLEDEDWRHSWKRHFGVQRIGRAIVIAPSWVDHRPKRGETVIRIDPGMAFGTGQHPTTAMCLRAVEDAIRGGEMVLDLGCGSGILAIAAAKLGAQSVIALDIDAQAVKAAGENAARNDVAKVVAVREGTLDAARPRRQFDLIVANISGLTLERLAGRVAASVEPGGRLVISGFLNEAVRGLSDVYSGRGFEIDEVMEDGVWCCIIARAAARRSGRRPGDDE